MYKPLLLLSVLCTWMVESSAQNNLPTQQHVERILPASPEASSIMKDGDMNVSLNTGAASASIPLYEIKLSGFSLPISLNYSTSGTKVDEVPGRTGMGWNLSGGGVISRKVNGMPDDQTNLINPPAPIATVSTQMVDYFNNITDYSQGTWDSEPDEFSISAYGLSGKFIIDASNNIVQIPFSNNKIEVFRAYGNSGNFSEIIVTTTEGIKYYFNVPEITTEHNSANFASKQQIVTALFLKKIVMLNGDYIEFNYFPIYTKVYNSITQSYEKSIPEMNAGQICNVEPGAGCVDGKGFNERVNFARYQTYYLTSIRTSNPTKLDFTYEYRPDNGQDNRLKKVAIDFGSNKKTYTLSYIDPTSYGSYTTTNTGFSYFNKRFFLDKVETNTEVSGVAGTPIRHQFEYNSISTLPERLAYCQDHFGYFNGQNNSGLLPAMPASEGYGTYALANREPDGSKAVAGTLKKITFPTGGSQEFTYEPNTALVTERVNTFTGNVSAGGPGGTNYSPVVYNSPTFTVNRTHLGHLVISAQSNSACTGGECGTPDPNFQIVKGEVINQTTNTVLVSRTITTYHDLYENVTLIPGNTYYLKITVKGYASAGEIAMNYDVAFNEYTYTTINKEIGGVRVQKITSYEPVANKTMQKYYTYGSLTNPSQSSALMLWQPDYKTYYHYTHQCTCNATPQECALYIIPESITCNYVNLNSSSATSIYMNDGSPFGYQTVIESDDPQFSNGSVVHHFDVHDIVATNLIRGDEMKNLPINTATSTSGIETSTEYFNAGNVLVKKVENVYSQQQIITSTATRAVKNFQLNNWNFGNTASDYLGQFDVSQYSYVSDWIKLDSKSTYEYDNNGNSLNSTTVFTYGSSSNILPIRTETTDSKGFVIKEETKYPTNYAGTSPYQRMIEKNIISPVIESKTYRNNNLVSTTKNNYYDFSASFNAGAPVIIKPQTIQSAMGSATLETKFRFHRYDEKGNPLEMSKENDTKLVYVWGYGKLYPVAEVVGAEYYDVYPAVWQSLLDDPATSEENMRIFLNQIRISLANTKAQVTTSTYKPLVGVTSRTDPNGRITYYQYDAFNRLVLVRDHDNNVLKKICYNYAGLQEDCVVSCANANPNWTATSTPMRCQVIDGQNTGYREREEQDVNPCSPTANQTRWVVNDYNPTACTPSSNVFINFQNTSNATGFTAVYTDMGNSNNVYSFAVPTGTGTLGSIPAGVYELVISKPGNQMYYYFSCICRYATGTSAHLYKVYVTASDCKTIIIQPDN